jgi:hypothetical protein
VDASRSKAPDFSLDKDADVPAEQNIAAIVSGSSRIS